MEKKKKNSKVTLLELVATKIIYAMLIVVYYWMWARRDWKDFYDEIIMFMMLAITILRTVIFYVMDTKGI